MDEGSEDCTSVGEMLTWVVGSKEVARGVEPDGMQPSRIPGSYWKISSVYHSPLLFHNHGKMIIT